MTQMVFEACSRSVKKRQRVKQNVTSLCPLQDYVEELIAALSFGDLDDIMDQSRVLTISQIAKPLGDFLASINAVLPSAVDRAFSACTNPAVPPFGRLHLIAIEPDLLRF